MFSSYVGLGFEHILDVNAYDHVLFIVALCVVYPILEWRKVLILITAFTLGHSISLALSVLGVVHIEASIIEFLIPITIIITALANILYEQIHQKSSYIIAFLFGGIHGLGFSNYLKAILGAEESIILPLLGFNTGVELGQIIVVCFALALGYFVTVRLGIKPALWIKFISIIVLIVSLGLLYNISF